MMDWLSKNIKGSSQSEAAEVKSFLSQHTWGYIDSLGQHLEHAEQTKYTKEQRHEIVTKAITGGKQEDLMSAAALTTKHSTLLKEAIKTLDVGSDDRKVETIERFARDMKFVAKHEKALQTARDNYHPEVSAPEHDPENVKKAQEHIKAAKEYQEELKHNFRGMSNSNGPLPAVAKTTPSLDSTKPSVFETQPVDVLETQPADVLETQPANGLKQGFSQPEQPKKTTNTTAWKPARPTLPQTQQTTASPNSLKASQDDILEQSHFGNGATTKKRDESPKRERTRTQ